MTRQREPEAGPHRMVPEGGVITAFWALGVAALTPMIALAGLVAVIAIAAAGAFRLVFAMAPQPSRARLAPVVHLELDSKPTDVTISSAA